MRQNETAQNGGAVKTEPRSPRLWILIVGICAVFFSFRGAIELLPPRFRGNTFGLWVFLAILLAPFAGVIVLRRLRRASEHAAFGIGLAWLWLLIPAGYQTVANTGYVGFLIFWIPYLNWVTAILASASLLSPSSQGTVAHDGSAGGPGHWRVLSMKAFALAMIVGSIFYFLAFDARAVERLDYEPIERVLFRIDKCALDFASAHPLDGFPKTLVQLGPEGSKCIGHELAIGHHAEFTVSYSPRPNKMQLSATIWFRLGHPDWEAGYRNGTPSILTEAE